MLLCKTVIASMTEAARLCDRRPISGNVSCYVVDYLKQSVLIYFAVCQKYYAQLVHCIDCIHCAAQIFPPQVANRIGNIAIFQTPHSIWDLKLDLRTKRHLEMLPHTNANPCSSSSPRHAKLHKRSSRTF